jgi:DNA-binding beta-propeller fold protein YncE
MAIDDQIRYLYVADSNNNRIRRININSPGFAVNTLPPTINSPFGLVIDDSNTNLYVSSSASNSVYKVTLSSYVLSLYAGSSSGNKMKYLLIDVRICLLGLLYGYIDGSLTTSTFSSPTGLSIDSKDNIYLADQYYFTDDSSIEHELHSIRLLSKTVGNVTTLAGRSGSNINIYAFTVE